MPKKVAFSVVTTSQSDEERTLTGTPSGSATHEEEASGSLGVSWLEEASGSAEIPASTASASSASYDDVDNYDFTPDFLTGALTPITDFPNRCCVDGQYQVYLNAMFLNNKGLIR